MTRYIDGRTDTGSGTNAYEDIMYEDSDKLGVNIESHEVDLDVSKCVRIKQSTYFSPANKDQGIVLHSGTVGHKEWSIATQQIYMHGSHTMHQNVLAVSFPRDSPNLKLILKLGGVTAVLGATFSH